MGGSAGGASENRIESGAMEIGPSDIGGSEKRRERGGASE
jgi:hypothetical protein